MFSLPVSQRCSSSSVDLRGSLLPAGPKNCSVAGLGHTAWNELFPLTPRISIWSTRPRTPRTVHMEYLLIEFTVKGWGGVARQRCCTISWRITKPGLDSLVAVELRACFKHVFAVDVSVLQMLAMGTLEGIGQEDC